MLRSWLIKAIPSHPGPCTLPIGHPSCTHLCYTTTAIDSSAVHRTHSRGLVSVDYVLLLNLEPPGEDESKVANSRPILIPWAHPKDETGSPLLEWKIPSLLWQQIVIICVPVKDSGRSRKRIPCTPSKMESTFFSFETRLAFGSFHSNTHPSKPSLQGHG